jgi:hypothetical protein
VHDLKRRIQGSPSFSFGAMDTPRVQSKGYSPMADFTDEVYGDRKIRKLHFVASYVEDGDEGYPCVPTFVPHSNIRQDREKNRRQRRQLVRLYQFQMIPNYNP